MRLILFPILAGLASGPAWADVMPRPGADTPRVQSVTWQAGERIVLTALPQTALTVILEPGERIERATLSGSNAWRVAISAEDDTFQVTPLANAAPAVLAVETNARSYEFALETGTGLMAAYLVRFDWSESQPEVLQRLEMPAEIEGFDWTYRVRGDRSVRPVSIRDNGVKTVIEYAPGQALPAVFAIGPSGDEEVVDGYMRGGVFVIDRVHQELVFRIDKEKATAKRREREYERQ